MTLSSELEQTVDCLEDKKRAKGGRRYYGTVF